MTREEFINWFEERFALTKNDIYELVQLYDEVTKPNWISVGDELPPKEDDSLDLSVDVLATNGNEVYKTFYDYYLQRWVKVDDFGLDDITHWMPLPEAPIVAKNATVKEKGGEE